MTPLSKQEALRLLHLPALHPPTCPLLFPLISLFFSSTCLFSQTAADCRRRRRAMSSDCELGWFGTLGLCDKCCPGPASPRLRGDAEFVATGRLHGDRAVRGCWASKRGNTCLLPNWCWEGLRTGGLLQVTRKVKITKVQKGAEEYHVTVVAEVLQSPTQVKLRVVIIPQCKNTLPGYMQKS